MAERTFSSEELKRALEEELQRFSEEPENEVEVRSKVGITEDGKPTVALGVEIPNATMGTVLASTAIGVAAYCGLAWILQRGRQFAHALKRCFVKFRIAVAFVLPLAAASDGEGRRPCRCLDEPEGRGWSCEAPGGDGGTDQAPRGRGRGTSEEAA
ncbi:uncharacterized protein LOC109718592 isoform X1 [Ananas comosus]|uniref:Uncharacterized protein LOC109718592 isoform X1 n=1 Tax=Ananas comosus TaxID=4615 RepID=A0A6P5G412_ANACO|nr:uncharacterized protein LOC109718592 isoform X1 [Ananas comosus]